MKLSVTSARLMHYAKDRIARFDVPLIDQPRIDYLKVYAGAMMYKAHRSKELHAFSRIEMTGTVRLRCVIS